MTRGEKVIAFIERYCKVPEGKLVGEPIKLLPFQRQFILDIYDNPHTTSRAYLSIARKNGKTALIAGIALAHLVGPEAVLNTQIVSGARSRDQAALVFKHARKMVALDDRLSEIVRVVPSSKELHGLTMNTEYKAISAEAGTAHGMSPPLAILDEVGQVRGPYDAFVEAIETAQGAHESPLLIAISTQAASDDDMFSRWLDDAESSGDCAGQPSAKADEWVAGLDLSAVNDLTAYVRVGWDDGLLNVVPRFWIPESGLRERSIADRVEYDVWHKEGFLETTPGKTVDYDYIAPIILRDLVDGRVSNIAFDRWNWRFFRSSLERAAEEMGLTQDKIHELLGKPDETDQGAFIPFGQGYQSMSPALRSLDEHLLKERIRHGDHPVLKMCAKNAVVKSDPAGNRKLIKVSEKRRIDGMIALAMAASVAGSYEDRQQERSYLEDEDLVML